MEVPRDAVVHLTADADLVSGEHRGAATVWPYTQAWRHLWRSTEPSRLDPINLLAIRVTPEELMETLERMGWGRPSDGNPHRTWVMGRFRYMADHIARGTRADRVHVRLFRLGPHTLVGAHHEVHNERGSHEVTSWDRARQELVDTLERSGFAEIAPTAVISPPNLREVPGDGRVHRVVRG